MKLRMQTTNEDWKKIGIRKSLTASMQQLLLFLSTYCNLTFLDTFQTKHEVCNTWNIGYRTLMGCEISLAAETVNRRNL